MSRDLPALLPPYLCFLDHSSPPFDFWFHNSVTFQPLPLQQFSAWLATNRLLSLSSLIMTSAVRQLGTALRQDLHISNSIHVPTAAVNFPAHHPAIQPSFFRTEEASDSNCQSSIAYSSSLKQMAVGNGLPGTAPLLLTIYGYVGQLSSLASPSYTKGVWASCERCFNTDDHYMGILEHQQDHAITFNGYWSGAPIQCSNMLI